MNLTTRVFRIFTFLFIAQLLVVGLWGISLYFTRSTSLPASVTASLTKVDPSILEGMVLQNRMGSHLARDLVAYKLLELNSVDSAEYLPSEALSHAIKRLRLENCYPVQEATICTKANGKVAVSIFSLRLGSSLEGYLKLEKSLRFSEDVSRKIFLTIGLTVLVVFLLNVVTLFMMWWKFLRPETQRLLRVFESEAEDQTLETEEFKKIQDSFIKALARIKSVEGEKALLSSELQKINLATQVAHDIRSPLEVLKSVRSELNTLPDSTKKRVQLSINRMEEITFNLLRTHKQQFAPEAENSSEELLSLIASVVIEKNIEFRNSKVIIRERLAPDAYGLFSQLSRGVLKSILSNIINNAVEACGLKGEIEVGLSRSGELNQITISDTGTGIEPSVAEKIFQKNFTTKSDGNGLGLYHAKTEVEALGGKIRVTSSPGEGTTFTLFLPSVEAPDTFIRSIDLYRYKKVLVLDDDPAFHEVWKDRFKDKGLELLHYYSIRSLVADFSSLDPDVLLLSDFELMDREGNGIDVILRLKHQDHSVLVTARNEELTLRERCHENGIKLLPKTMVAFIPVITNSDVLSVILIDDDRLVHLNWASFCEKNAIHFTSFRTVDDFLVGAHLIDPASRIYIDSNLEDGVKGEIEAEKIFNRGFSNIYLSTGEEKGNIEKPVWIKDVFSKSPDVIFHL